MMTVQLFLNPTKLKADSHVTVGFEWYAHRSSGREQSLIAFAGGICFYVWTKQIYERGA